MPGFGHKACMGLEKLELTHWTGVNRTVGVGMRLL